MNKYTAKPTMGGIRPPAHKTNLAEVAFCLFLVGVTIGSVWFMVTHL